MTTLTRHRVWANRGPNSTANARAILRYHGRSFHLASQLLGQRHAARAARLYAFCRHVDDLADRASAPERSAAELVALRRDIAEQRPRGPVSADLLALADDTGMPLAPALALIDGVRSDLAGIAIADESELLRYAHAVAGTVGVMMCYVLDVRNPAALPHAIDLGMAMQLTNIARDVEEDARAGRRYLPASWVGGVEAARIATPDPALRPRIQAAVARALGLAEAYYASGRAGLVYLPPRARPAIQVAAALYRAIGDRIAAGGYESWHGRIVVGRWRKLGIATSALIRSPAACSRPVHDPGLHRPIAGRCGADERALES